MTAQASPDPRPAPPAVLVAHDGQHGATAEIATTIADELTQAGLAVDCRPVSEVRGLSGYGAVVLGSAVYMRRWRRGARRFLSRHADELRERELWLFSSGPVGEKPDPEWSEPPVVVEQAERLGAHAHVVFGGRVPLDPSGFVERAMAKNTPEPYRDLREWQEIRAWAREIAAAITASVSV